MLLLNIHRVLLSFKNNMYSAKEERRNVYLPVPNPFQSTGRFLQDLQELVCELWNDDSQMNPQRMLIHGFPASTITGGTYHPAAPVWLWGPRTPTSVCHQWTPGSPSWTICRRDGCKRKPRRADYTAGRMWSSAGCSAETNMRSECTVSVANKNDFYLQTECITSFQ